MNTGRPPGASVLPYHDTKPEGAADFYFAINATFRFVLSKLGRDGWVRYVREMARDYYRPVWEAWRDGGTDAVAEYQEQAFRAEPGAVFEISRGNGIATLEVRECPAIKHLRASGREIVPYFCEHCYHQGSEMATRAGLHMRLKGGNGSCRQTFSTAEPPPQNMAEIEEAR